MKRMRKDHTTVINESIESLAESIISENYLDKDLVCDKLKIFLTSALSTILNDSFTQLEQDALELKEQLADGKFDYDNKIKMNKMYRLGAINDKIKQQNRASHSLQDYNEYSILKAWVIKKFGDKAIIEYFQLQPPTRVGLLKRHIQKRQKQVDKKDDLVYSTKNTPKTPTP